MGQSARGLKRCDVEKANSLGEERAAEFELLNVDSDQTRRFAVKSRASYWLEARLRPSKLRGLGTKQVTVSRCSYEWTQSKWSPVRLRATSLSSTKFGTGLGSWAPNK